MQLHLHFELFFLSSSVSILFSFLNSSIFRASSLFKAFSSSGEYSENDFSELPDGEYTCKLEKLELGESSNGKPMIKGMFRIVEGEHKKQCLFYNQVFCRSANGNAFSMHKGLEFLRSLQVFDESEIDFDGDYEDFNDLLLDIAEEAEGMTSFVIIVAVPPASFDILSEYEREQLEKSKDGEYTRLEIL